MKTIVFALLAAVLVAAQVFSPAMAATSAAVACGDTYTVQRGDYLSKIAQTCDTTLSALLSANPEIKDQNKIYPGQVIRIKAGTTITTTPSPIPVTGGEYTVVRGDTLYKIAVRYGTTVTEILRVNPSITNASRIYTGQKIKLPGTTSGGTIPTTSTRVTLSATSAKVGGTLDVKIAGFPANASVDLRVGKEGQAYTSVYDGTTDASGAVTVKITIPSTAKSGEKWVVRVMTTDRPKGVEVVSPTISITS